MCCASGVAFAVRAVVLFRSRVRGVRSACVRVRVCGKVAFSVCCIRLAFATASALNAVRSVGSLSAGLGPTEDS
eukprot:11203913-Lingulodinium_polyedra.AAC.1